MIYIIFSFKINYLYMNEEKKLWESCNLDLWKKISVEVESTRDILAKQLNEILTHHSFKAVTASYVSDVGLK